MSLLRHKSGDLLSSRPEGLPDLQDLPKHQSHQEHGFTLLEVLVALTVFAVGAALTMSLISGSLGNIRKVQMRTKTVEHAEAVMELALLDRSIDKPTAYTGYFEDGTHWSVHVDDYEMPVPPQYQSQDLPQNMPVKLLSYSVEMFYPDSKAPDYRLKTLKLINKRSLPASAGSPP